MAMTLDEEQISLLYYEKQQCSRQWVHLIASMFAEFEARVDPAEADRFLETLGSRMARSLPLQPCDNLNELEDRMNAALAGIDWGWVRVTASGRFIEIIHGAYPMVPQDEARRNWLVPILEGIYTEWLSQQGGDRSFVARLAKPPHKFGAPIAIHYGRHGERGGPAAGI
jgi:Cellulose synthase subunit D